MNSATLKNRTCATSHAECQFSNQYPNFFDHNDNMNNQDSICLYDCYQNGSETAAYQLFDRYVSRLIGMVRVRLSSKLAQRIDPEDIVQSAYRSFFCGAENQKFLLQRSGDLWALLASITINKLGKQIEKNTAAKRNIAAEKAWSGADDSVNEIQSLSNSDPGVEEAVMVIDEVEHLMSGFDPVQREMLEMRLSGYRIEEISDKTGKAERTVRRLLDKVKSMLMERRNESQDD